jgi:hypothetical protein
MNIKQTLPTTVDVAFDVYSFSVTTSSFEIVHGLSRIFKITDDKLKTAIAINLENHQDKKDDGSFLVDLLVKLLQFYENKSQTNMQDFTPVIADFRQKLLEFNDNLGAEPRLCEEQLEDKRAEIVKWCDMVNMFCHLYLDLLHNAMVRQEMVDMNAVASFPPIRSIELE